MAVHDELRARRRAGGEIEQHRIVGRASARRAESARSALDQRARRRASRRRLADRDALDVARRLPRISPRPAPCATRNFACPRSSRSAMSASLSCGIAGISTRPSFIAASIVTHSSGVAPSIIRSRSPRFAPIERRPLARRAGLPCDSSAKVRVSTALADHLQRRSCAPWSPAASSASNQSSAQLNRSGRGQTNGGLGGDVAVVELEQKIARLAEGRRLGEGRMADTGLANDGGHSASVCGRMRSAAAAFGGQFYGDGVDARRQLTDSMVAPRPSGTRYPRRLFGA